MRKIVLAASVFIFIVVIHACKKSDNNSSSNPSARTVQNFSGSYNITAITANALGTNVDIYDSLPACERDNVIQLNTDKSAHFIDANIVCVPPSDSTGTWSLSSNTDTLYIAGSANFIKAWDGKTLTLTSNQNISGIPIPVTATTTLVKQ